MSSQVIRWIVAIGLLWGCDGAGAVWAQDAGDTYQVGVAQRDITPDYPIRLNGFGGRRAESEGVGQRIWAKALAISQAAEPPVVLITVDSLGLRLGMVEQVAAALKQSHEVPRENVVATFSHSHCTPKLDGASDTIFSTPIPPEHQEHITRYTAELTEALIEVAREAIAARQPARLDWAVGTVGFAMNRRTPGGPVDHSLPVLFVRSPQGELRAVYTTYACHCVTLSYNKLHGDWAGCAQEAIGRDHPGVIAMVSIGCGSDANPDSGVTGAGEAIAAEQGGSIAAEVKRLLAGPLQPVRGAPAATLQEIELPLQTLPSREQLAELSTQSSPAGYNALWQLAKLDRDGQLLDHLDYPIQTLRFGDDLAMVYLAGEVCVDYALRLRQELNADKLWLHGYSNDFCAYIPSERLLREGGYGGGAEVVYFALPAMLAAGMEDKIVAEVTRQLPRSWRVDPGTQGTPPTEPKESLHRFQLPAEFEIQLVASEPQIQDPVAIDFGLDGRLWVVEMADYARAVDEEFVGQGRVKWLEDRDGDGQFESSTVFIDGLRFPTDVKVWRDGILICDAPNVLFARDTNEDGRADVTQVLLTGFATHNPHARVNSLRWGLDGWLYGSCGLFGGEITTAQGAEVDLRGRDFRWRPDTGELEPVTGTTQQGRARDDWNHWFGCDNGTLLRYYPIQDRYLRRAAQVTPPATQISPLVGPDPGKLFPAGPLVLFKLSGQAGQPTSACGLGIYRDDYLGAELSGNSFTCEPVNQLVHRRVLQWAGTDLQASRAAGEEASEFLTSTDRWFRPVQARTGPDGGLWVVDMYRYVIEHPRWIPEETRAQLNVFAGQDRGRIYRVVRKDQPAAKWPVLAGADAAQLLAWAADPNGTVRDLAHQRIVWEERGELAADLASSLRSETSSAARVQLLAILADLDQIGAAKLEPAVVVSALDDRDPRVREWALQCAESSLANEEIRRKVIRCLVDDDARVRQQALWSLGQSDQPDGVAALIAAWPEALADPVQRCAVLSSLSEATVSAWQTKILNAAASKNEPAWSDPELLRVAFAGLTASRWQTLFLEMTRDTNNGVAGLDEPRFRALLQVTPTAELKLTGKLAATAAALRESAFDSLASDQTLTLADVESRLDVWLHLPAGPTDSARDLLSLVDTRHPVAVQSAVARRLAAGYPAEWDALLARLQDATPTVQSEAIDTWLQRRPGRQWLAERCRADVELTRWLTLEQRNRWLELMEPDQRGAIQDLLDLPPTPERAEVLTAYQESLDGRGSLPRGQQLFVQHCGACHRFGDEGGKLGPDLNALGNKTPRSLLTSILDPSRDIDARYRNLVVETVDGQTLSGLLLEETGTTIRLQLDRDKQLTILRADVESLRANPVSFMPVGLEKDVAVADMRDLLVYLMTPRQPPKAIAGNTPAVIHAENSGDLLLPASAAEIFGGDITYEAPLQNIGFWHGANDFVVWRCDLEQPGTYRVELEYACAEGAAGNRLRLAVADAQLTGAVAATGGWDQYRVWPLGEVELPTGELRLSLEPAGPLSGALLDLKSVRLVRIADDQSP